MIYDALCGSALPFSFLWYLREPCRLYGWPQPRNANCVARTTGARSPMSGSRLLTIAGLNADLQKIEREVLIDQAVRNCSPNSTRENRLAVLRWGFTSPEAHRRIGAEFRRLTGLQRISSAKCSPRTGKPSA